MCLPFDSSGITLQSLVEYTVYVWQNWSAAEELSDMRLDISYEKLDS